MAEQIRSRLREHLFPSQRWRTYTQPTRNYDPDFFKALPPVLLLGFFQSEYFFCSVSSRLRAEFRPRAPLSEASQRISRQIEAADWPVALHVRRGDYVRDARTRESFRTCSAGYYHQARRLLESLSGGRAQYFVFSDEPESVMDVLESYDSGRLTIVSVNDERPWEHLFLMATCRDNIIANSSFSWWGAWLNARADKTVVAPRRWFQRQVMLGSSVVDLIPDSWITI